MVDDGGSLETAFGGVKDGESDDAFEVAHRQFFSRTTRLVKFEGLLSDGVAACVGEEDEDRKPEVDAVDRIPVIEKRGNGVYKTYAGVRRKGKKFRFNVLSVADK